MKLLKVLAAIAAGAAMAVATGCLKVKTIVTVNPDGSGNIVMQQLMTPQMAAMLDGMAKQFGGDDAKKDDKEDPFFKPEELKAAAAMLGEGVEFVKAEKVDKDGCKGSLAVYSFKDINKIKVNPMGSGAHQAGGDKEEPFSFKFAKGSPAKLTIQLPQDDDAKKEDAKDEKKDTEEKKDGEEGAESAELAMAKQAFAGMEIELAVEVKGAVKSSNATLPPAGAGKNRFILMRLDMDKAMESKDFLKEISKGGGQKGPGSIEKFNSLPGIQIESKKELVIEFE